MVCDDSLVNLLIQSINQLQDSIDCFSTFIENRLIQALPAQAKCAGVKSAPAPAVSAAPPVPVQVKPE